MAHPYGSSTAVIVYCVVAVGRVSPTRIKPLFRTSELFSGPVGHVPPSTCANKGSLPCVSR
jgi:hypothetical protein